jgi:hypothetical protein
VDRPQGYRRSSPRIILADEPVRPRGRRRAGAPAAMIAAPPPSGGQQINSQITSEEKKCHR